MSNSSNLLWPAPEGKIAIVCCNPNNLHTIKYDKENCPAVYTPLDLKVESSLNVYDSHYIEQAVLCGFNVLMYPGSDLDVKWIDYTQRALNDCLRLGVKLISNSPILNYTDSPLNYNPTYKSGWPTSFVQQFKNHPALGGWMVKDEPKYEDWHGVNDSSNTEGSGISQTTGNNFSGSSLSSKRKTLISDYQAIKNTDTRHIAYMNLAVGEDQLYIGEEHHKYEDFLDEFIAKFDPPLLTFDFYPIKSDEAGGYRVDRDLFYKYLNIFANKSQQYGIPFWSYCLCLEHTVKETVKETIYPVITEGMLRFEAFSALAFGAQGIVFWGYKQDYKAFGKDQNGNPINDENGEKTKRLVITDGLAPVDLYGNLPRKSQNDPVIWDMVQNITAEIADKNDYFYKCKMTSHNECSGNNQDLNMNGEAGLDKIRISGRGFLMTRIETPDQEKTYSNGKPVINKHIVIVNTDPFNSQELQWLKVQDSNSTIDKDTCTKRPRKREL